MTSRCPKCRTPFERPSADRCDECGWTKRKEPRQRQGGIQACAYVSNGERCHYPGTTWNNVHGVGPGFCRFHANDYDPAYGARVIEQSRTVPYYPAEHTRACQARPYRDCLLHAMPGKDLCYSCAKREANGEKVMRIKRERGNLPIPVLETPVALTPAVDWNEVPPHESELQ